MGEVGRRLNSFFFMIINPRSWWVQFQATLTKAKVCHLSTTLSPRLQMRRSYFAQTWPTITSTRRPWVGTVSGSLSRKTSTTSCGPGTGSSASTRRTSSASVARSGPSCGSAWPSPCRRWSWGSRAGPSRQTPAGRQSSQLPRVRKSGYGINFCLGLFANVRENSQASQSGSGFSNQMARLPIKHTQWE